MELERCNDGGFRLIALLALEPERKAKKKLMKKAASFLGSTVEALDMMMQSRILSKKLENYGLQ